MKLASIVPVHDINRIYDGQYAMLLAHLKDYYPEKSNPNCYTIMDNSLIELGGAVSMEVLMEAAAKLNPDEIILPDVFCKGEENYRSILKSLDWLANAGMLGKYRLMAVCHGENYEVFKHYFNLIMKLPEITCIGVPKVMELVLKDSGGRPSLEPLWQQNCTKQIHLLGCWSTLRELKEYKHPALVRSVDTCIPALLSKTSQDPWVDRPKETIDLLRDKIDKSNYESIMERLWEVLDV